MTTAAIDPTQLRKAWGQFVTGVTVVTVLDPLEGPAGLTANSFTSVSLDPPLVLVSIDRDSSSHPNFQASSGFVVHVLGADQQQLAERFASSDLDRWEGLSWEPGWDGLPVLADTLARFVCQKREEIPAGDHSLFLGEVKHFELDPQTRSALVFWQGSYHQISPVDGP